MESKFNRAIRISAFVIGIGFTAMHLNAQQGTFDLPVSAHWGLAVLAPGEHSVRVPFTAGSTVVYVQTEGSNQMAVPLNSQLIPVQSRSYLHLARINGDYYVDEYQCGANGKIYAFPKPSARRSAKHGMKGEESLLVRVSEK